MGCIWMEWKRKRKKGTDLKGGLRMQKENDESYTLLPIQVFIKCNMDMLRTGVLGNA